MTGRRNNPPKMANWILSRLIGENFLEEFEGDLLEIYQDRLSNKGLLYARCMYWIDTLHLALGFLQKKSIPMNRRSILKHYFVIAFRNLSRNKVYAAINILSLAVGMGICLSIVQYVYSEFNQDRDLTSNSDIYRLTLKRSAEGSLVDRDLYTAHSLGTIAKELHPEITAFTRLYVPDEGAFISRSGRRPLSVEANEMFYVDRNFLSFMHIDLLAGDAHHALDDLFSVVISEKMAKRHFGDSNPIGQILTVGGGASHGDYVVTGVFPDRPEDSHLQFDFLFPILNFMEFGWLGVVGREPHVPWFATYFKLMPSTAVESVESKLDNILATHKTAWNPELILTEQTQLQAVSEIHLDPHIYANADYVTNKGNKSNIESFLLVAVIILVIAWFNYINLSTAQSMRRAKEVGIRKSMGAKRHQLIYQFLSEALMINLLAATLAVAFGLGSLGLLAQILGEQLSFTLFSEWYFWLFFLLVVAIGSILSGSYPAFLIASHKPANIFSGKALNPSKKLNLRSILVTIQFLVSLVLISGTYLVYKQIAFMQNEELGMDMDQILVVKGPKHIEVLDGGPQLTSYEGLQAFHRYSRKTFTTFRAEMLRIPSIHSVTGSWTVPGEVYHTQENEIRRWGQPESENQSVRIVSAGLDFVKTYDLQLIAGKSFSPDLAEERAVILNERAVRAFGFSSPEEAVGDRLYFGDPLQIIGVVSDYHWQSLKEDYSPWIIWFTGSTPGYFSMKLSTESLKETIPQIQQVYDELYPGNPFEYFFIDDQFNRQYQADFQFGRLFLILTLLAVGIACVGLFALISHAATTRIKEIGIRKVLGASASQLMVLLSREYFRLMVVAIILAVPLISYLGTTWLNSYAFRIDLGLDTFILPGGVLILLSILTAGHRTLTAARTNPADSLRSE